MFTAFIQSIKALRSNPVRTMLTTLGIVIGIATVILVLSAGEGFRSLINSQLEAFGTNTLFVETRVPPTTKNRGAGAASNDQSRARSPVAITSFKNRDVEDIKRLPNVKNAYGMVVGQKVTSYQNTAKNVIVYGASSSRFDIDKGKLSKGRFYSMAEDTGGAQVIILGSQLAEDLFRDENPLDKLVRIGELNFQVIGVYEPRGGLGGNEDSVIYMPINTAQKKLLGIDYLLFAIVEVKDQDLAAATAEDIRLVMRHNHNIDADNPDKDDFFVQTQADALNTFNTIFNGITILLIAIAAIALIVGGVGIMNIMYVVVTERTSEIGLKKALGAKENDILNEFLIESVLVTVLGGIMGILAGAFLGWIVSLIAKSANLAWTFSVPLYSIAIGFGVSASIGMIFGVLPARAASKLDPVEAMRYE
ncbi:MAG: ABC transporter permease [Candidatus Doudnabacteria bacterium]|nr:ABC transporter permease [Candidatus Doudnabacteria bacterium]